MSLDGGYAFMRFVGGSVGALLMIEIRPRLRSPIGAEGALVVCSPRLRSRNGSSERLLSVHQAFPELLPEREGRRLFSSTNLLVS